jgi:hypothetical protein
LFVKNTHAFLHDLCSWIKLRFPGFYFLCKIIYFLGEAAHVDSSNTSVRKKVMDKHLQNYLKENAHVFVWSLLFTLDKPVELQSILNPEVYFCYFLFYIFI